MSQAFAVDPALVERARTLLASRDDIWWVLGGACTGKSTVCQRLAEGTSLQRVDMDARIYGEFSYDAARHPAVSAWFSADNPLAWVMALSWEAFDALNRATNAEFLDLLASELSTRRGPLIIDGGLTHPSVLAQVVPPGHIVCLATTPAESARCWEESDDRAQMRQWIRALPDPDAMWAKFLMFDRRMSETMVAESRSLGIDVVAREPGMPVAELQRSVLATLSAPSG